MGRVYNSDIDLLCVIGNESTKDALFSQADEEVEYNPHNLSIGHIYKNGNKIKPYYLDLSESCRIICIGATRSGKSWVARRFGDTVFKAGNDLVYLTDVKNEMWSSTLPLQSKFIRYLDKGEYPLSTPVVVLRPTFFKRLCPEGLSIEQKNESKEKREFWSSINISKLTLGDFMDLIKAGKMADIQKAVMEDLYYKIMKHINNGGEFSFEYMFKEIEDSEELKPAQKRSIQLRLKPLLNSYFYEAENEVDVINLIENGVVPIFNFKDYDNFSKDGFYYPDVFLSIIHRELVNAKRKGLLRKLWIIIDEAGRMIGTEKDTQLKKEVEESFELNTAFEVNYLVLTQSMSSLSEKIIKNSRYIFIPARAEVNDFRDTFMRVGIAKNMQWAYNQASYFKREMKPEYFDWCVIDKNKCTADIVRFFAPLSRLIESGE